MGLDADGFLRELAAALGEEVGASVGSGGDGSEGSSEGGSEGGISGSDGSSEDGDSESEGEVGVAGMRRGRAGVVGNQGGVGVGSTDLDIAFREAYDEAMETELRKSDVKGAKGVKSGGGGSGVTNSGGGEGPVDVDVGALRGLLASYEAQMGMPGPAGSLAGSMGFALGSGGGMGGGVGGDGDGGSEDEGDEDDAWMDQLD